MAWVIRNRESGQYFKGYDLEAQEQYTPNRKDALIFRSLDDAAVVLEAQPVAVDLEQI